VGVRVLLDSLPYLPLLYLDGLRLRLRLVLCLVEGRPWIRLVGLRLVARLVGLRLAARLVLVGLRATIRLGGLRLTRLVGVRLLDILVPPGERLRRRTRGDRGLREVLLVRGEYDIERVRCVCVGERRVCVREGDLERGGEYL